MPKIPNREVEMVTIPRHEYRQMKAAAIKWRLLSGVIRNSKKWADSYGNNERGDLCRGIATYIDPVMDAIRETLDEDPVPNYPAARRAWDLAVVNYLRRIER